MLPTPAPGIGYYYVPAAHLSGRDPVWAQDNRRAPERARSGGPASVRAVDRYESRLTITVSTHPSDQEMAGRVRGLEC